MNVTLHIGKIGNGTRIYQSPSSNAVTVAIVNPITSIEYLPLDNSPFAALWWNGGKRYVLKSAIRDAKTITQYLTKSMASTIGLSDIGKPMGISITSASEYVRNKVTLQLGDKIHVDEQANSNFRYLIPMDWCEALPNASQGILQIKIESFYRVDTKLGENLYTRSIAVPEDVVPSIDSLELTPDNGLVPADKGYREKIGKLSYSIQASSPYGAEVQEYSLQVGSFKLEGASGSSPLFPSTGQLEVLCRVRDSRGREATHSQSIEVLPYHLPNASNVQFARALADGSLHREGEYLKFLGNTAVAEGFTKSLTLYVDEVERQPTGELYPGFTLGQSHALRLAVSDGYHSSSYDYQLDGGFCLLNIRQNAVAIGGFAEEDNTFEVHYPLGAKLKQNIKELLPTQAVQMRYVAANGEVSDTASENVYLQILHPVDEVWEWMDLPETLNTEYRTRERFDNKVVYSKFIAFGRMANNNIKAVAYASSGMVDYPVRVQGWIARGNWMRPLPLATHGADNVWVDMDKLNVRIRTHSDWSGYSANVRVWYTKVGD